MRPSLTFVFVMIIAVVAAWVNLPGGQLDPYNWKEDIYFHQGLDLQGGLQVVLEARPPDGREVDEETLNGARDTIERRVNGLGVSEPLIQTRGDDQIIVELPGVGDPESAVQILQETALLEIIDPQGEYLPEGMVVNTTAGKAEDHIIDADVAQMPDEDAPVFETLLTGAQLEDANPIQGELGQIDVGFELDSEGAEAMRNFTSANQGQPMSIVLDKRVINSATIQSTISNRGSITGMNREEVQELVVQLKSGSLAVPLEVTQSRTVGPSLGQDSIDQSIVAGSIGLGLVALFMVLFYRLPGLMSVFALAIYTMVVFGLFQAIPVVLTLAGLAGFILSIGMAVDANILIFSRMKEELRQGNHLTRALEVGFDRAWPSIRDSNIATMITSVILYWFGQYTGASIIQGFALTLFIGVSVSMFSAITVTRTFLRLMLESSTFTSNWWLGMELPDQLRRPRTSGD